MKPVRQSSSDRKIDFHSVKENTKYRNASITGQAVHSSLTLHQLSASGYYEGG